MTKPTIWLYPLVLVGSLTVAWACTPLARRLAEHYGIVDQPGGYKRQAAPVPYLGGIVMVLAFSGAVLLGASVAGDRLPLDQLALFVLTGVGLSLVGLADDLWTLSPFIRLFAEVLAGAAVWLAGSGVDLFPGDAIDAVITIVWVVGVANAFNFLDNMDGLSAGVAAIAAAFFFAIAAIHGQYLVASLSLALCGCALGFLRHNFHPARIYMGDAGSLFLGFLLAVLGLKLRFDAPVVVTFAVPIVVLGVALLDTALVVMSRLAHRRNPFLGGADHVSHRLVLLGIPVPAAVALIYAGAVALGWLAVALSLSDPVPALLLLGFVMAVGLFLGIMLSRVPVYENSRRRRMMLQEVESQATEPPR